VRVCGRDGLGEGEGEGGRELLGITFAETSCGAVDPRPDIGPSRETDRNINGVPLGVLREVGLTAASFMNGTEGGRVMLVRTIDARGVPSAV